MNKSLAACALRAQMHSGSEAFSIATFALTFGAACIAAFVLVVLGAGAEAIECSHLDEIATQLLEALRCLRPGWLDGLDGLDGLGQMRRQMTRAGADLAHPPTRAALSLFAAVAQRQHRFSWSSPAAAARRASQKTEA